METLSPLKILAKLNLLALKYWLKNSDLFQYLLEKKKLFFSGCFFLLVFLFAQCKFPISFFQDVFLVIGLFSFLFHKIDTFE